MNVFTSKIFVCIVTAVLIAVDIYLASDKTHGNTYSELIRNWALLTPLFPYVYGVLGGHFFILRDSALFGQPSSVVFLAWTGAVWLIVGFGFRSSGFVMPALIPLIVGLAAGHYFWPQHMEKVL